MLFGMREGNPRGIVTTTPRPTPLIKNLRNRSSTHLTVGSTWDNRSNLSERFYAEVIAPLEGTRLGRQEINAEILEDVPGALWTREMFDGDETPGWALRRRVAPEMARIVVAIDPSGTAGESDKGDTIGIVVAGKGVDGRGYVLADRSCKLPPAQWGAVAVRAYKEFKADRIVAERNYGGAMVAHVIRTCDSTVAYREVVASRGKVVRAEPVAALYEQRKISHVGTFAALEDQMCAMTADGYVGEGSPDRLDAAVWAFTDLMLSRPPPQAGSAYPNVVR
jgi:phage terminase large subunit-like protein